MQRALVWEQAVPNTYEFNWRAPPPHPVRIIWTHTVIIWTHTVPRAVRTHGCTSFPMSYALTDAHRPHVVRTHGCTPSPCRTHIMGVTVPMPYAYQGCTPFPMPHAYHGCTPFPMPYAYHGCTPFPRRTHIMGVHRSHAVRISWGYTVPHAVRTHGCTPFSMPHASWMHAVPHAARIMDAHRSPCRTHIMVVHRSPCRTHIMVVHRTCSSPACRRRFAGHHRNQVMPRELAHQLVPKAQTSASQYQDYQSCACDSGRATSSSDLRSEATPHIACTPAARSIKAEPIR
jgi:hypothetical protein